MAHDGDPLPGYIQGTLIIPGTSLAYLSAPSPNILVIAPNTQPKYPRYSFLQSLPFLLQRVGGGAAPYGIKAEVLRSVIVPILLTPTQEPPLA